MVEEIAECDSWKRKNVFGLAAYGCNRFVYIKVALHELGQKMIDGLLRKDVHAYKILSWSSLR